MICEFCDKDFNLPKTRGGMNRKYCFECIPLGLSNVEKNKQRRILLTKKSALHKIEIGCSCCGYNKSASALEWHHVNDDKDFHPSYGLALSWEAYLEEVKKCTLLCANCHREVHEALK